MRCAQLNARLSAELCSPGLRNYHTTLSISSICPSTDGSKDPNTGETGFAFSIPSLKMCVNRRTSDHLSVDNLC